MAAACHPDSSSSLLACLPCLPACMHAASMTAHRDSTARQGGWEAGGRARGLDYALRWCACIASKRCPLANPQPQLRPCLCMAAPWQQHIYIAPACLLALCRPLCLLPCVTVWCSLPCGPSCMCCPLLVSCCRWPHPCDLRPCQAAKAREIGSSGIFRVGHMHAAPANSQGCTAWLFATHLLVAGCCMVAAVGHART